MSWTGQAFGSMLTLVLVLVLVAQYGTVDGLQQPPPPSKQAKVSPSVVQQHVGKQAEGIKELTIATDKHQLPPMLVKQRQSSNVMPSVIGKLKDVRRHRRGRFQQRHHNKKNKKKSKRYSQRLPRAMPLMVEVQPLVPLVPTTAAASTIVALESIVEEVARVTLAAAQTQQQLAQQAQRQVSSIGPPAPMAILLEGSSSPMSPLHQGTQVGPAQAALQQQQQPPRGSNFFLTSMLSRIMSVLNVTEFASEMRDGISSRASCMACNAVVGLFMSPLYSKEVFGAAIRTVCTSFQIQKARVCSGLVEAFQDDLDYIRKNTKLTRDEVCAVVFGVDCARRPTNNLYWTVYIPEPLERQAATNKRLGQDGLPIRLPLEGEETISDMDEAPDIVFEYRKLPLTGAATKSAVPLAAAESQAALGDVVVPPLVGSMDRRKQLTKKPKMMDELPAESKASSSSSEQISKFVQITDIHVDPYYEPGYSNDCNEPLCCRATSGPVAVGDKRRQAGKWGDYGNCDSPIRTIRSALNRIRADHSDAEYWIWTGDISPHDIWNISRAETTKNVRLVSQMVRDYSNGLPVFPVIGNHEAHPVNSFSPPEIKGRYSMSWLYDLLADEWAVWLPKDAIRTLRIGGYYKLQVRKGFRIIALNTNYCARLNPWSFYDPVDPAKQLKWLVDELLEAELNRDKVHIIGHVPPDNRECTQAWLFNFINIVDRFKDTIEAQFYGHTHRDEWRIIYSMKRQDEPIGIQYIGPSITPFTENNPAFRTYHQDRQGRLVDSHTYFFNLTEANESPAPEPNWRFSYSTQRHLNMTNGLSAHEWHQYLQKLHDDEYLFESFYKNFYRSSDVKLQGEVCRAKCKYQMLSDLRLTHPYKTKPKPFMANRKTSNHHSHDRNRRHHHHHHHHHYHRQKPRL